MKQNFFCNILTLVAPRVLVPTPTTGAEGGAGVEMELQVSQDQQTLQR